MSRSTKTLGVVAALICSCVHAYGNADACRVATRMTIENLNARLTFPDPEYDRIQRGLEQLIVLDARCSSARTSTTVKHCGDISTAVRTLGHLSPRGLSIFKRITGCGLVEQDQSTRTPHEPPPDPSALIVRTLREQQESYGEAGYWIANDLLALVLVYPEEVIATLKAYPSFQDRFFDDLNNLAFEDVEDSPGSKHLVLREKLRVFRAVMSGLQRKKAKDPECAKILSELTVSCAWSRLPDDCKALIGDPAIPQK